MPDDLRALIRHVPDFPTPGTEFRDITPLLGHGPAYRRVIGWLSYLYRDAGLDAVAAIESRGFIFGGALAERLGVGFVPIRKQGKLPAERLAEEYVLEYGRSTLEIHRDAVTAGQRVALVDDLLATGGTALASAKLLELLGAEVHAIACVVEIAELGGRQRLQHYRVDTLIRD